MKNQKFFEKEILKIAITGQAVAVHKEHLEPMTCSKDVCKDCLNYGENGKCKKDKTTILTWMNEEYVDPAERVDWSKVAIDTPVLVRDDENDLWRRRYFAGYNNNEVYVFSNGTTSYTCTDDEKPVVYKHARLAELPFNRDLFYQMYEQLLTLPADCQRKEDNCNENCPYCKDGDCMYYHLKGFVEDNPDILGDIETELSTDLMMT